MGMTSFELMNRLIAPNLFNLPSLQKMEISYYGKAMGEYNKQNGKRALKSICQSYLDIKKYYHEGKRQIATSFSISSSTIGTEEVEFLKFFLGNDRDCDMWGDATFKFSP